MTYDAIIKDLQKQKYAPVYFLYGDESYFIDKVAAFIEHNVLDESEKAFNQIVLYGKDADFKSIVDECRQFPMMASRRVVIIREAQDMKSLNELAGYIERPAESAILVICYKYDKLDKRTKFAKILEKNATCFESKKMYDDKIPSFIIGYVQEKGYRIRPEAADLLAEYVGNELNRLANEIEKLCVGRQQGTDIDIQMVKDEIGLSRDFSVFNLQTALAEKNIKKSAMIIRNFIDNPKNNPEVVVISTLYSFFYKVFIALANSADNDFTLQKKLGLSSPYFVAEYRKAARNYNAASLKKIFTSLKKADLHSKGMGARSFGPEEIFKDILIDIQYAG